MLRTAMLLWSLGRNEKMGKKDQRRLDVLLVERGLAESRAKARALVLAGQVFVEGRRVDKAGYRFPVDVAIRVRGRALPYVSRGGLKLAHGLDVLGLDFSGLDVLDVGASTGGFTDCLLQRGARRVIALDVGYGQLHWRLRKDPRVFVLERTNIRHTNLEDLPFRPQAAVVDVSFISLKLVLPVLATLLPPGAPAVVLVKPQFEAGRHQVGKKGVVRDEEVRRAVLESVCRAAEEAGFEILGHTPSPILGPKGNQEYLLGLRLGAREGRAGGQEP